MKRGPMHGIKLLSKTIDKSMESWKDRPAYWSESAVDRRVEAVIALGLTSVNVWEECVPGAIDGPIQEK